MYSFPGQTGQVPRPFLAGAGHGVKAAYGRKQLEREEYSQQRETMREEEGSSQPQRCPGSSAQGQSLGPRGEAVAGSLV